MLHDFGHIDPVAVDDLLVALAELYGDETEVVIDVAMLKPIVAGWLIDGDGDGPVNPVLTEDWPLVFS